MTSSTYNTSSTIHVVNQDWLKDKTIKTYILGSPTQKYLSLKYKNVSNIDKKKSYMLAKMFNIYKVTFF